MNYVAVIAHKEGVAVERVLPGRYETLEAAQPAVDTWTRKHGHRKDDTDVNGFYAYADRIRPGHRIYL